jgi:outer membrane lipoprotein-sorting protein
MIMKLKSVLLIPLMLLMFFSSGAQDLQQLIKSIRQKMSGIQDYTATGKMKTNVSFLKVPVAKIKLFYKAPDQIRIKSESGVSFIPKGAVNMNVGSVIQDQNFMVIDAGTDQIDGIPVKVARLLPNDPNGDIILSTLYIDPVRQLILKSSTTTRDNGTYELKLTYKNYISRGLPDKIVFSFNTKDYKLPKGITFDFDDGTSTDKAVKGIKKTKGEAEITLTDYQINKGLGSDVFK